MGGGAVTRHLAEAAQDLGRLASAGGKAKIQLGYFRTVHAAGVLDGENRCECGDVEGQAAVFKRGVAEPVAERESRFHVVGVVHARVRVNTKQNATTALANQR